MSKQLYPLIITLLHIPFNYSMDLITTPQTVDVNEVLNTELLESGLTQEQIDQASALLNEHFQEKISLANANIKEDIDVIRVAASLTGSLETLDRIIKIMGMEQAHLLLREVKYAARMNILHKLVMGANPGKFADETLYTDAKTESLGYTLNNLALDKALSFFATTSAGKWCIDNLYINNLPDAGKWISKKLFVGIIAHLLWTGQKATWISSQNIIG